jgi:hypothetical protein
MNPWIATAGVLTPLAAASLVWRHRRQRDRMYDALARQQSSTIDAGRIEFRNGKTLPDAGSFAEAFAFARLVRIEEFVSPETMTRLRDEALASIPHMEHSFIPLHKKGNTLSYENILRYAPHCLSFYQSLSVQRWISAVTGVTVLPTPVQDQSSLSILCYKEAGEHINWHYDHNFYRGRHFTVLLSLVNRAGAGGVSHSRLERQLPDGSAQSIDTSENTLVIFEGSHVRHRATPSAEGDLRVILSMTYCADPRISPTKELIRRIKDTAFYGVRALWD